MEQIVFSRMNEKEQQNRRAEKQMQFLWRPRFSTTEEDAFEVTDRDGLFSHVLFDHYTPPDAIPALYYHSGGNMKENHRNAVYHTKHWLDYFELQAKSYQTRDVLVMWGDDFAHYSGSTYDALDIMIDAIWEVFPEMAEQYEITYSTITDYFTSVKQHAKQDESVIWPIAYTGDFWEYNFQSTEFAYWSGYFSTYPDLKRSIGQFSDFYEAFTQVSALDTTMPEEELL